MKTLLKRRIAAIFVAGILLFSNYGILAFADDVTQDNSNSTEQVNEEVTQDANNDIQEVNDNEEVNNEQEINNEEINNEEALNNEEELQPMDTGLEPAQEPLQVGIETTEQPTPQDPIVVVYDPSKNVSSGIGVGGFIPTIFQFEYTDTDNIVKLIQAYCNQYDVFIQNGAKYEVEPVYDSNDSKTNNLRGILLNGYPTKTLQELKDSSGLTNLTEKQAIAATQMAIWNISREESQKFTTADNNARLLYDLLKVKTEEVSTPRSTIVVNDPQVELVDNVVKVKYSYSINTTNQIKNYFIEDKFEMDGFVEESRITENGLTTVIFSKIIDNMEDEFSINGNIKVEGNIGFYDIYNLKHMPKGEEKSQGLMSLPFINNYNLPGFTHLINFKYTPPVKPPTDPPTNPPVEQPPVVVPPVRDNNNEVVVVEDEETPLAIPGEPDAVVATVTSIEVPQEEIIEEIVPYSSTSS